MRPEARSPAGHSLTRRLLLALLPPLTLLALVGAALDYQQARTLARAAYDQALGNTAVGMAVQIESDRDNDSPEHMAALADTLGQKMQHAAGTAAEIDDLFALFDSNAIELRFGVRAEGDDLARQPLDFGIVASEQVAVGLGHGASRVR